MDLQRWRIRSHQASRGWSLPASSSERPRAWRSGRCGRAAGWRLRTCRSPIQTPGHHRPGVCWQVRVILLNLGREPYTVQRRTTGIGQMIVARYEAVEGKRGDLAEFRGRGAGGFGSSAEGEQ